MSIDYIALIIRVGLGILGVRGYPDTVVGDGWMSWDCPGWSGYPRRTGILRHTAWLGTVGCPGIVRDGLGILSVRGCSDTLHGWGKLDVPGLSRLVWVY